MKKKEKVVIFMIPLVVTLIKAIFFVPVNINGGLVGLNNEFGYISLIQYYFEDVSCADCYYHEIIINRYIMEFIVCFLICLLLSYVVLKIVKKIIERR